MHPLLKFIQILLKLFTINFLHLALSVWARVPFKLNASFLASRYLTLHNPHQYHQHDRD